MNRVSPQTCCLANVPYGKRASYENKAVYTEGLVACCWAGAVTILYTQHQALAELLLIVSIAQIVLSRQFGSFSQTATDRPTDRQTDRQTDRVAYRVACTRLKTKHERDSAKENSP